MAFHPRVNQAPPGHNYENEQNNRGNISLFMLKLASPMTHPGNYATHNDTSFTDFR